MKTRFHLEAVSFAQHNQAMTEEYELELRYTIKRNIQQLFCTNGLQKAIPDRLCIEEAHLEEAQALVVLPPPASAG
ncbi:hypothetical protein ACEQPO_24830 [Bacillus sp. SL00103]